MTLTSKTKIIGLSTLLGVAVLIPVAWSYRGPSYAVQARQMTDRIWVTEQLRLEDVEELHERGFQTIIDLRADGEAPDQPPSSMMGLTAQSKEMQFAYVPVGHGDIPEKTVAALDKALTIAPGPVLLYCRTGRRAARTWSLVEASRRNGMQATEIEHAVRNGGQYADDLDAEIKRRINLRGKPKNSPT
jgi:uncharacterized protein (TIGR01244 family)